MRRNRAHGAPNIPFSIRPSGEAAEAAACRAITPFSGLLNQLQRQGELRLSVFPAAFLAPCPNGGDCSEIDATGLRIRQRQRKGAG